MHRILKKRVYEFELFHDPRGGPLHINIDQAGFDPAFCTMASTCRLMS